jgi:hypothetical protein
MSTTCRFFLILTLTNLCLLSVALAQEVKLIGRGDSYACLYYEEEGNYIAKIKRGSYLTVPFNKHISLIKNKIKQLKGRRLNKKSTFRSDNRDPLNYWKQVLVEIRQCKAGTLEFSPLDPGENPIDNDKNPPLEGNDGTSTPNPTGPCAIIGAPNNAEIGTSIINGEVCSNTKESPVVQLILKDRNGSEGSCSGTVVSQTVIVTAAHCLYENPIRITIKVGSRFINAIDYQYHHSWNPGIFQTETNDVGIVVAEENIGVSPVAILDKNDIKSGELALIAGFGLTENLELEGLRAGFMTVKSVTTGSITALFDGSGSNSCNGDSGGPLFIKRDNTWYLAGTTSNGDAARCGVIEGTDISRWSNLNDPSNKAFILITIQKVRKKMDEYTFAEQKSPKGQAHIHSKNNSL